MKPIISILMCVYNGSTYIAQAIESMLNQTYTDFEFIILNDASTDNTAEMIKIYAAKDPRIMMLTNEKNMGLTKSLNKGLAACQGTYVARMDADDISVPDRLQTQIDFMELHPKIVACGSQGWYIDERGKKVGEKNFALSYEDVKHKLLFNNQFIHSSLFLRRDILVKEGGYNESFKRSQDYELMVRLGEKHNIINLKERLVQWRVVTDSLSWSSKRQERDALRARWWAVRHYHYPFMYGMCNILLRLGWYVIPQRIKRKRYSS